MAELIKNVEHASIFTLKDLVEIESGRVNSLTLSQTPGCKMTVFAVFFENGIMQLLTPTRTCQATRRRATRSSQCSRARAKSPLTTCRTSFPQVNLSS